MKFNLIYFLILFTSPTNIVKSHLAEYCNISCGIDKPVICRRRREKCQRAPACQNPNNSSYITMEQKHLILYLHNKIRNQMALGLYNDLKATDMLEMTWSNELEDMAVCWANACHVKLDTCVRTLDNQEVGQNIVLLNWMQLSRGILVAFEVGLDIWFSKRDLADLGSDQINSYDGYRSRASNDFTQVIWGRTRFVGCGRILIGSIKPKLFLVCNYIPAGNIPGEKVYTVGDEPCSQCPKIDNQQSRCSREWPSLCKTTYFKSNQFYKQFARNKVSRWGVGSGFALKLLYMSVICCY